jgi:ribosome-binding protein aMBF1 (putative translation factor)
MSTVRIDWFRIITDLQRAGLSHKQQALEIGVDEKTIRNWQAQRTEPRYSYGARLLDIYRTVKSST